MSNCLNNASYNFKEEFEVNDLVKLMLETLNNLVDILEANPLFEDEYYLALILINDIEYIVLDNPQLLKENLNYIKNITINFCQLIYNKQSIDYKKEYKEFTYFFNKQQEQFYNTLPEIEEDYEEIIDKITMCYGDNFAYLFQ